MKKPTKKATKKISKRKNPSTDKVLVFGINWEYGITFSRIYTKSSLSVLKRKLEDEAKMKVDQIFVIDKEFDMEIYPEF